MEEDQEIEDIFKKKKKKIKSGIKGKRVERGIVNELNERFKDLFKKKPEIGRFSRSVGSGNRWSHNTYMSKASKDTYVGDITCPEGFKFVLESKGGYNTIDLCGAFLGSQREIDEFLKQVSDDSIRSGRMPLLFWKKDYKPRLAFLLKKDLGNHQFEYIMNYGEWIVISYENLISLEDNFFFNF